MPPAMLAPAVAAALAIARPIRPCTPKMPMLVIRASWASRVRAASGTVRGAARWAANQGLGRCQMADREKEVIVTDGGGGSGAGMLIGVVLVLAVLAILFFVFKDRIFG